MSRRDSSKLQKYLFTIQVTEKSTPSLGLACETKLDRRHGLPDNDMERYVLILFNSCS
jgi:hypothetical protein